MGTDWPVPADLSALDPVCLNKRREVKGGQFVEGVMGLGRVCMQRLFCVRVCVYERGREREKGEEKRWKNRV